MEIGREWNAATDRSARPGSRRTGGRMDGQTESASRQPVSENTKKSEISGLDWTEQEAAFLEIRFNNRLQTSHDNTRVRGNEATSVSMNYNQHQHHQQQ